MVADSYFVGILYCESLDVFLCSMLWCYCLIWFWRMHVHVLQFALLLLVCVGSSSWLLTPRWFSFFQIPHLRPAEYKRSRLSRNRRTVNRPYGGVLSGTAVRERLANSFHIFWFDNPKVANLYVTPTCFTLSCRIIRAFLVEEQKIVKKVLKLQKTKDKTSSKK